MRSKARSCTRERHAGSAASHVVATKSEAVAPRKHTTQIRPLYQVLLGEKVVRGEIPDCQTMIENTPVSSARISTFSKIERF